MKTSSLGHAAYQSFQSLEWPLILDKWCSFCLTQVGQDVVKADESRSTHRETLMLWQQRVSETKRLVTQLGGVDVDHHTDTRPTFYRLDKQGYCHSAKELTDMLVYLQQLRRVARFFIQNRSKDLTPTLLDWVELVVLPNEAIDLLDTHVSEWGEFRDSASPVLASIKQRLTHTRQTIKDVLNRIIWRQPTQKYLQENLFTEREGRFVLPVKVEHKSDVPGIIHGVSGSGGTVFVEPKDVIELNNTMHTLQAEYHQEVQRLLKYVSECLQPKARELLQFCHQVGHLDALLAKAKLSRHWQCHEVNILPQAGSLNLRQARHPLLLEQLQTAVVANSVEMSRPHQVLVITGPNTGGKTVVLKLVGLCAVMLQHGLHLPVAEDSSMSVFDPVFADIGDAQNITQNLSTFSGHMTHIKSFLESGSLSQALILMDEICAGTDPEEGTVLAQSILEQCAQQHATVMVTTHLGQLKLVAYQNPVFLNASVEFDANTLRPTYRLMIGIPGTSHAFHIAAQLGLPRSIIERAQSYLTRQSVETTELLTSLESQHVQVSKILEESETIRHDLETRNTQLEQNLIRLEQDKRNALDQFRQSVKDKILYLERMLDDLRQDLRDERQFSEEELEKMARQVRQIANQSSQAFLESEETLYQEHQVPWDLIQVGRTVQSRSLNLKATVVAVDAQKKQVTLQAGLMKSRVPHADILRVFDTTPNTKTHKKKSKPLAETINRAFTPSRSLETTCDLRGKTVEEALTELELFMDNALMHHVHQVEIIHGQGTGALKKAVRQYLKTIQAVKTFGPAPAIEGGDGKTIVNFE